MGNALKFNFEFQNFEEFHCHIHYSNYYLAIDSNSKSTDE